MQHVIMLSVVAPYRVQQFFPLNLNPVKNTMSLLTLFIAICFFSLAFLVYSSHFISNKSRKVPPVARVLSVRKYIVWSKVYVPKFKCNFKNLNQ
jgi:hypothetical protein